MNITNAIASVISRSVSTITVQSSALCVAAKPGHYLNLVCSGVAINSCFVIGVNEKRGTLELAVTQTVPASVTECEISSLLGNPIAVDATENAAAIVAQGNGFYPALFLIRCLQKQKRKIVSCVIQYEDLSFPLRPSRFMLKGLPAHVIAAVPLLEDLGIPSRVASEQDLPGCFEGGVVELANIVVQPFYQYQSLDVYVFGSQNVIAKSLQLLKRNSVCLHPCVIAST